MIKVGSDFSGVGAFNQALMRLGIDYKEVFACDMDKHARQTFIDNYGEPEYYPTNVYNRVIPVESLDIYMTSPPCQAFSLAGKRLGKDDKRGILFFNSLEFIQTNKPRYFIFENVKGLLSDDNGKTFSEWVNLLGGKSVNGNAVLFAYEESVPYHIYWQVLNAKDYGVPQNRERVFIIGIRDDVDNNFRFPIEEHLTKRLKDVLEEEVDEKYFLNKKMLDYLEHQTLDTDLSESVIIKPLQIGQSKKTFAYKNNTIIGKKDQEAFCIRAAQPNGVFIYQIKSATSKGYEEATEGDSINFAVPNSETRRGRVGKQVAQTLDTECKQAVIQLNKSKESNGKQPYQQNRVYDANGICPALNLGQEMWGGNLVKYNIEVGRWRTYKKNKGFEPTIDDNCPSICARARKDGSGQPVIKYNIKRLNETLKKHKLPKGEVRFVDSYNQTILENSACINARINATSDRHLWDGYKIRRLTPRECFRLMDFPDTFTWSVSDSQAYKQAGNSIVVAVLYKIIKNLNL